MTSLVEYGSISLPSRDPLGQVAKAVRRDMKRRDLLCALGAAGSFALLPGHPVLAGTPSPTRPSSRLDALAGAISPRLDLLNAHTGERLSGRFFNGIGYSRRKLRQTEWFMRDWRERESKPVDARLLWALAALRQAARAQGHSGEIVFLSGYRSEKTNTMLRRKGLGAARNSFHLEARAVDFVVPGVPVQDVATYAEWLQVGGTGHYRRNFIHIDTGPERTWIG